MKGFFIIQVGMIATDPFGRRRLRGVGKIGERSMILAGLGWYGRHPMIYVTGRTSQLSEQVQTYHTLGQSVFGDYAESVDIMGLFFPIY